MKKIMVIGCCGAGKSTFSKRLELILSLDVIHLDKQYWKPNWERPDSSEWKEVVSELCQKENWIMDGNYNSTIELRAKYADTIIFLDYSPWICMYRVLYRMLKYKGTVRDDMPTDCEERFDLNFIKYVWSFKKKMRGLILDKLDEIEDVEIVILKNDKEANRYLDDLKTNQK